MGIKRVQPMCSMSAVCILWRRHIATQEMPRFGFVFYLLSLTVDHVRSAPAVKFFQFIQHASSQIYLTKTVQKARSPTKTQKKEHKTNKEKQEIRQMKKYEPQKQP